ncbi:MAG: hypothetical protein Q4E74_04425 [Ruminococcus sp.]|nr:hypothetical protein [Ruminococcus sp.]
MNNAVKKYMRIQGREIAYRTGKPVGIFILNWRKIRDGIYTKADAELYESTYKWFLKNLPEPPFYGDNNDNPQGAITYFKTASFEPMREKAEILMGLLDKYKVPYDIVYTDYVGKVIYEDEYQVAVIDE